MHGGGWEENDQLEIESSGLEWYWEDNVGHEYGHVGGGDENRKRYYLLPKFEGSRPEWCISSMIYSRDTLFWSGTLEI